MIEKSHEHDIKLMYKMQHECNRKFLFTKYVEINKKKSHAVSVFFCTI